MHVLVAGGVCSLVSGSICEENEPHVQLWCCTIMYNILISLIKKGTPFSNFFKRCCKDQLCLECQNLKLKRKISARDICWSSAYRQIVFHPLVIDESTQEEKRVLTPGRTPALRNLVEGRILRICQRGREQMRESDATAAENKPSLICTYNQQAQQDPCNLS